MISLSAESKDMEILDIQEELAQVREKEKKGVRANNL